MQGGAVLVREVQQQTGQRRPCRATSRWRSKKAAETAPEACEDRQTRVSLTTVEKIICNLYSTLKIGAYLNATDCVRRLRRHVLEQAFALSNIGLTKAAGKVCSFD